MPVMGMISNLFQLIIVSMGWEPTTGPFHRRCCLTPKEASWLKLGLEVDSRCAIMELDPGDMPWSSWPYP